MTVFLNGRYIYVDRPWQIWHAYLPVGQTAHYAIHSAAAAAIACTAREARPYSYDPSRSFYTKSFSISVTPGRDWQASFDFAYKVVPIGTPVSPTDPGLIVVKSAAANSFSISLNDYARAFNAETSSNEGAVRFIRLYLVGGSHLPIASPSAHLPCRSPVSWLYPHAPASPLPLSDA